VDATAITTNTKTLTLDASAENDGNLIVKGGAGNDSITGSASDHGDNLSGNGGNDTFLFATANLTSADTIAGGDGTDVLQLTTDGSTVVDADFTKVTSVETVTTSADARMTALTLDTLAAAAGVTTVTMADTTNVDTVNVNAGFTNNLTVNATTGANIDVIAATAFTKDLTVNATEAMMNAAANSFKAGTGTNDTLVITGDGTGIATGNMADIENFETIKIATDATSSIALHDDNIADEKTLTVDATAITTNTKTLTLDASAENDGNLIVKGGAGNDSITGSASDHGDNLSGNGGNDTFLFASVANLTSADTIAGGDGAADVIDFSALVLEANTNLTDAAFKNVSGVEQLKTWVFNDAGDDSTNDITGTLTLGSNAQTAGITTVTMSATDGSTNQTNNADTYTFTIDASAYTSALTITTNHVAEATNTINMQISTGSGNDTITAGAGDDTIVVSGGGGADKIDLTGAGVVGTIKYNLSSDLVSGTTATNGDVILNWGQGNDKIELVGATLQSGGGGQIVLSSVGDSIANTGDVAVITNGNEAAELASITTGADSNAYILHVDLDTEMGAEVFYTGGAISQSGVTEGVNQLISLVGTTAANTNIIFALDDGTNTALFHYQEGALDAGIQSSELSLMGVIVGESTALADGDFT
jgi:hypothetical protein